MKPEGDSDVALYQASLSMELQDAHTKISDLLRQVAEHEDLIEDLVAALRITSNCSPTTAALARMVDTEEIRLVFCAEDIRQIRSALLKARP